MTTGPSSPGRTQIPPRLANTGRNSTDEKTSSDLESARTFLYVHNPSVLTDAIRAPTRVSRDLP